MACNEMNSWTFAGLVGAFLDLSIAYLFLCGSTLVYLASKFLGLFGLSLPVNGLFGYLEKKKCIQAMLVHNPSLKISPVQYSIMKKLPFYEEEEEDDYWKNGNKGSFGSIHKWRGRHRRSKRNAGAGHSGNVLSSATPTALNSSATFSKLANDVTEDSMASVNSEDGRGTAKEIELSKQAMAIKRSASNQDFNGSDKNTLRVLGQALDEEHATCAALYIELEKERSAAASAADEAMAMILRLQEEKAAIEMEAKQYRRTIEAKSAYDAEEMNILKEIMIRREREKYFLEKEVEACMQMFYRKEQLEAEADTYDITVMHERGTSSEEQGPLPVQQFNLQIAELDGAAGFLSSSIEKNEANIFRSDDENLNHQERHVDEKTINGTGVEEKRCDSGFDCRVIDVHVISGASNVNSKQGEKRIEKKAIGVTSNESKTSNNQTYIEPCMKRNSLDRSEGLPPLGPSQPKSMHRKSRSAFDYERSKIDNEVGWLRERLKIVQLGKEKLNFPAGHRENEQVELQILEDIVSQLREIRQLTEPGKALRQAYLPPLSSKVLYYSLHDQIYNIALGPCPYFNSKC
ncbi:hypothetical protein F3Y22_tig00110195pilonHSYRG00175 [Hibiscus syriacus]|uniref:GTD-binding domain-containing protein n=1 Tax=Hibiscus syriacus TaxID=106335 RepID=A0A6A3BFA7_HIBSY|nr:hypothetical protein F3Y22_tig00110195pilonHSYRG00175 [Hibiscus syriacus]